MHRYTLASPGNGDPCAPRTGALKNEDPPFSDFGNDDRIPLTGRPVIDTADDITELDRNSAAANNGYG